VSGWDDLVTTALLGTERRALPESLPPAVGRLAVARPDAGPPVLDAAAGYVSYLTAGARPAACPVPDPAPRQVIDLAPEPAQALLRRLLDAGDAALVDEWLAECGERGLGVRAGSWTALASAAAGSSGPDRSLVRTALGERGLAFLRLNPAWRSVLRPPRSAGGGAAAGDPTAHPWSDTSTRQALDAVRVTPPLGRRRVSVVPPGAGPHLQQVVADADLGAWRRHTGLAPGPLLDLLRSSSPEHVEVLTAGFAEAAVRQRHAAWATALARSGHVTPELVAVVPGDDVDALALSWGGDGHDHARVARWLTLLPAPWSAVLTDAGLRLLASARLDARAGRRLGLVLGHRAALSAHEQAQRTAGQWSARPAEGTRASLAAPPGLLEAAEVLARRVEIRQAFGATARTEETP